MKIRRKTEITIQTERFLRIRKDTGSVLAVCPECGAALVTPEAAGHISGKRTREIYREIENGERHFIEIENGELLVCRR